MKLLYLDERRAPKWCRNILRAEQQKASKLRRRNQIPTPESGHPSSEASEVSILTKEAFVNELNASKSTFSLATGRPLGKVSARVAYMQNMIKAVEAAGGRWRALFASADTSAKSPGFGRMAARQMGGIMGLALKVYHELPRSKRKLMTDLLRRATVYARMVEDGKILTYGQVNSAERARLSDAVADELMATFHRIVDEAMFDADAAMEGRPEGMSAKTEKELWRQAVAEASRHDGVRKNWLITGYKDEPEKDSSADDKRKASSLFSSYAANRSGLREELGAALERAIARLAQEYKSIFWKNPLSKQYKTTLMSARFKKK